MSGIDLNKPYVDFLQSQVNQAFLGRLLLLPKMQLESKCLNTKN
jgi:hypothetical protein